MRIELHIALDCRYTIEIRDYNYQKHWSGNSTLDEQVKFAINRLRRIGENQPHYWQIFIIRKSGVMRCRDLLVVSG